MPSALGGASQPRRVRVMLFLFNDVVFDLGDPEECALSADGPLSELELRVLSLGKVLNLVREAILDDPKLPRNRPEKAKYLAALVAWKTVEANALLVVPMTGAKHASQVGVRLANLSLFLIAELADMQAAERLTAHAVNQNVWAHAPKSLHA